MSESVRAVARASNVLSSCTIQASERSMTKSQLENQNGV